MVRSTLLLVGITVVLCSCSADSATSAPNLQSVLIVSPPANEALVKTIDAPMSQVEAAQATPLRPEAVRAYLQRSGYRGAYARIWRHNASYVTVLAYDFVGDSQASGMVDLEVKGLKTAANTYVGDHKGIPSSSVFVIGGSTRYGNHSVICEGIWFAVRTDAFDVMTCSDVPSWATEAESLAQTQYDLAERRVGK